MTGTKKYNTTTTNTFFLFLKDGNWWTLGTLRPPGHPFRLSGEPRRDLCQYGGAARLEALGTACSHLEPPKASWSHLKPVLLTQAPHINTFLMQ